MLQKFKITTCAIILCFSGLSIMTISPVFASDFGDRLTKCNNIKGKDSGKNNKNTKMECYKKLISGILEKLKKQCGNQYKNLTTKVQNKKNLTYSKANDYCNQKPLKKVRDKIQCFMELAKHATKQYAYYEETSYCK